jgi:HEAT repeat protein
MIEKNQLKAQGLAFARAMQAALRTVMMYSVDHPAADKVVQQAYGTLNTLLKQTKEFTFGFHNQRVQLNNLLTSDSSLGYLEAEFSKRGIANISFLAGIPLRGFKRGMALLSTKPSVIEEKGGIKRFLEHNPIEGMRFQKAAKAPGQTEDTVLGMDSDSFRTAQAILEADMRVGGSSLDLLLQSGGPGGGFTATQGLEFGTRATREALGDAAGDLRGPVEALARMLAELKPDSLLAAMPPSKQGELSGRPALEVATDVVEDVAVDWAVERLKSCPAGPEAKQAEEEVLQALLRGLKATQVADRLLRKLARFIKEAGLPDDVYERLRQGVAWYSLSREEKRAQLLQLKRFGEQEFRRLINYALEMMGEGRVEEALEVAKYYFACLDSIPTEERAEEYARMPNLLRAIAGPQTLEFMRSVTGRLGKDFLDDKQKDGTCHRLLASCLSGLAQNAGNHEDFETVQKIGLQLSRSLAKDNVQHAECCGVALSALVAPTGVARLVELYLEKREDPLWARTVSSLLKLLGPQGAETPLQFLEVEASGPNRMRLIRLIGQLGPAAIEPARKRLAHERWYVVRNACFILGDLGDPDLPKQLAGALKHPEGRVQQAAVTAMIKCNVPGRGAALAGALIDLQERLKETALEELTFLKDPAAIDGLEQFVARQAGRPNLIERAVQVLAATSSERAVEVLGKVLADTKQLPSVRKAALTCLSHSPFSLAQRTLIDFVRSNPNDPLAVECRGFLGLGGG